MIKYGLLWIQIKLIQEVDDPLFSDVTFIHPYSIYYNRGNEEVVDALCDCRDSTF